MIAFTPFRTRRITVQLKELTVEDVMYLLHMPAFMYEAGTSEFLRRAAIEETKPRPGQVADPRLWTVNERAMLVAHYLAHTEAEPNFAIGESGHLSDYILDGENAPNESVHLGIVSDDDWHMRPLLGFHAECVERLITTERISAGRAGWWLGAMACQLFRAGKESPDLSSMQDDELDDHIEKVVSTFKKYPESDFLNLLSLYLDGQEKLQHLLIADFNDDGVAFRAKGGASLPLARFPVHSCINEGSRAVFGKA